MLMCLLQVESPPPTDRYWSSVKRYREDSPHHFRNDHGLSNNNNSDQVEFEYIADHSPDDVYYKTAIRKVLDRRMNSDGRVVARDLVDAVARYRVYPHQLVALDEVVQHEIAIKLARMQAEFTGSSPGLQSVVEKLVRSSIDSRRLLQDLCISFGYELQEKIVIKEEQTSGQELTKHVEIMPRTWLASESPVNDAQVGTPVMDLLVGGIACPNPRSFSAFEELVRCIDKRFRRPIGYTKVWPTICEALLHYAQDKRMPLRIQLDLVLRPIVLDNLEYFPELLEATFVKGTAAADCVRNGANRNRQVRNGRRGQRHVKPTPIVDLLLGKECELDPEKFRSLRSKIIGMIGARCVLPPHLMKFHHLGESGRKYHINPHPECTFSHSIGSVIKGGRSPVERRAGLEKVLRPFVIANRELFPELAYYMFPKI
ncbi:hypothetical protein EJ08DRAFT_693059 [Tothia fuscella]|uniref:Uncharacterized protein n=1 Tax=Tothia fuscella TaxID=1048955 RepID=A0A9P4U2R4_9PEZI|nr:hypothetical protein EJ08DRAFT_693059 [Tothia fuscella]